MYTTKCINFMLMFVSTIFFYAIRVDASVTNHSIASKTFIINSCNFAPYPVKLKWVISNLSLYGQRALSAGECANIDVITNGSADAPLIRLYAEPEASNSFQYLKESSWYSRLWQKISQSEKIASWPGKQVDGILVCSGKNFSSPRKIKVSSECGHGEEAYAFSRELSFDKNRRADWVIVDHAICDKLSDLDCYAGSSSLEAFSIWAKEMSLALNRLYFVKHHENVRVGLIPSHTGIRFKDTNRMFNEGIEVVYAESVTPFGTPIQLQKGDTLLFFNGKKVFGRDIIQLIYDAGKQYGYNHANKIIFERNGELFSAEMALYFDENLYGAGFKNPDGSCKAPVNVAILNALNEFLFYQQTAASCLLDGLASDNYYNFDSCKFQRDQFLAAYKQFCPKATFSGSLVGGLSFLGRSFVEKFVVKKIPGMAGKSLSSRVARAALLEAGEESMRVALTSAPALPTRVVIDDMIERGKLQGAIGVGFQIMPKLTTMAIVPIIYNSYQEL